MVQLKPIVRRGVGELTKARPSLSRLLAGRTPALELRDDGRTGIVCHCRKVEYAAVRSAIAAGARNVSDLQRSTTACTRCFGCRVELEEVLRFHLGDRFVHQATVTLPPQFAKAKPARPMYMPVLAGFAGSEVDTRVIVFNWEGEERPVPFRVDLLRLDGARVRVWEHEVTNGRSAILDLSRAEVGDVLPDGVGVVKLVLDADQVGSLRPYFHFVTPTSISSTHEKKGPADPNRRKDRSYHWIFPVGVGARAEDAYFFCTNTQMEPMRSELVFTADDGAAEATPVPPLEFDQTACVALHEAFPAVRDGTAGGAVRLAPATHAVAGFIIRHDPARDLWRVQHL